MPSAIGVCQGIRRRYVANAPGGRAGYLCACDQPDGYGAQFCGNGREGCRYDLQWEGKEENEIGIDRISGRTLVRVNPKFYRPAEVDLLIGDPEKAKRVLGWEPTTTLEQLCQMMVEADIRRNESGFSF